MNRQRQPTGYDDNNAVLKLKQRKRNELMDSSFELNREVFKPFVPDGISKIRFIPGPDAQRVQALATFVRGAEEYKRESVERWLASHRWSRVWILDAAGTRTTDHGDVPRELVPFVQPDGEGRLFFLRDGGGRPANLPEYLNCDLSGIKFHITSTLGVMAGIKNEQMIATTLEDRDPPPAPIVIERPTQEAGDP